MATSLDVHPRIIQDQIEWNKIESLLKKNKLPTADIKLQGNILMGYHNSANTLVGVGGLELYGNYALLRSVAIEEEYRGNTFGKYIVDDLIDRARQLHIKSVYLLTETARAFFVKKGFKEILRTDVPEEVLLSTEFRTVCPATATCMVLHLD